MLVLPIGTEGDLGFLERGFICIKVCVCVCVCGGGGHVADFVSFFLNTP